MRITALLAALCASAAGVRAALQTAHIYIQPIDDAGPPAAPSPLAEVAFDTAAPSHAAVVSYEAPELPAGARVVRIGVYDAAARRWVSGTTAAAADNFAKGYSPHVVLALDTAGNVVSASCRGVAIDAGQTRDFGPQVVVRPEASGPQPLLNKPVVLSPEGKKVEPEQEKTFLQKYWWMIGIAVFIALSGGGGTEK